MKFLLPFLFILCTSTLAQTPPPIDVEMARKELLTMNHLSPGDFIRKLEAAKFNIMYAGDRCFVHLPFKSYAGEGFEQGSDLMVYWFKDGKWVFDNLTSAWYDVTLINADNLIFQSNSESCETNGKCETFKAISHYDGLKLLLLRDYKGFNNRKYYDMMQTGKIGKTKFAAGDTVKVTYDLSNFMFEQHQTSYTLKYRIEVISVITKDAIKTKLALDTFERVIANH